jgi:hypothetical protein
MVRIEALRFGTNRCCLKDFVEWFEKEAVGYYLPGVGKSRLKENGQNLFDKLYLPGGIKRFPSKKQNPTDRGRRKDAGQKIKASVRNYLFRKNRAKKVFI